MGRKLNERNKKGTGYYAPETAAGRRPVRKTTLTKAGAFEGGTNYAFCRRPRSTISVTVYALALPCSIYFENISAKF